MRPVRTFIKFDFAPHWSGHRAPRLAALARASDRAFLVQWPREADYQDFRGAHRALASFHTLSRDIARKTVCSSEMLELRRF